MAYVDLTDILTTQQKVSCVFQEDVADMASFISGIAAGTTDSNTIAKGAKVELPIWLSQELNRRETILKVDAPKAYQRLYRSMLEVDPEVVDLRKLGPWYYATGLSYLSVVQDDSFEVARSLARTFVGRFRMLTDQSSHSFDRPKPKHLDKDEEKLYESANSAFINFVEWQNRSLDEISVSSFVKTAQRKRKFMESC